MAKLKLSKKDGESIASLIKGLNDKKLTSFEKIQTIKDGFNSKDGTGIEDKEPFTTIHKLTFNPTETNDAKVKDLLKFLNDDDKAIIEEEQQA